MGKQKMRAKSKVRKPLPPLFYFLFLMNPQLTVHIRYVRIPLRSLQSSWKADKQKHTEVEIHQNVTSGEYKKFKFVLFTFLFCRMSILSKNTQEKHT